LYIYRGPSWTAAGLLAVVVYGKGTKVAMHEDNKLPWNYWSGRWVVYIPVLGGRW
jgi:hypothetical protein